MEGLIAEVLIAIIAFAGTLVGSIMVSQKTIWRIDQLEKKVEKHNQVLDRFAVLEYDEKTQWKRMDELHDELEKLREEVNK